MTNNNLTDERLSALIRVARDSLELYEMELPVIDDVMLALAELQQRRAAMIQGEAEVVRKELVGWQFKSVNGDWLGLIDEYGKNQAVRDGCDVREVFAMTDSVNKRDAVREAHAEWSDATFGNVGPIGPLKHLSKEALEAAAEPDDLSEWADMQFLFWDAQRRAGISDGEITAAMEEKLKVNMARQWPEPKDGEPRLHIKADGNSPVIAKAYDIEAFGVFSATEGENGMMLQIELFRFGTGKCPQIGKENMVPKFALQAIINRLQEHCDSMGNETLVNILSAPSAPKQEDK